MHVAKTLLKWRQQLLQYKNKKKVDLFFGVKRNEEVNYKVRLFREAVEISLTKEIINSRQRQKQR